jgi:hypothetical protein
MRRLGRIAAIVVGLGLAAPVGAQQRSPFATINPRDMTFTPVSTTQNIVVPPSVGRQPFSVSRLMPHLSLPSFLTPKVGISPLPPASSFPSTHYQSPIQPIAPFTPGQ